MVAGLADEPAITVIPCPLEKVKPPDRVPTSKVALVPRNTRGEEKVVLSCKPMVTELIIVSPL